MEHGKKNRKFGRETKQRKALMRSLAVALITNKRIKTTTAKAKSLKTYIEKIVAKGKKNDRLAKQAIIAKLGIGATRLFFSEVLPKLGERNGGYTSIHKYQPRISDGSQMSIIEFIFN